MFPIVRLIIVAMFASLVAVSCGLGVFAAFRVNHQPFTRLQSADPPLQLVFGNGVPPVITDASAAPFGVRFQLNARPAVPATMPASSIPAPPAEAAVAATTVAVPPAEAAAVAATTVAVPPAEAAVVAATTVAAPPAEAAAVAATPVAVPPAPPTAALPAPPEQTETAEPTPAAVAATTNSTQGVDPQAGQKIDQQASQQASPATEQDAGKDGGGGVALEAPPDQSQPIGPAAQDGQKPPLRAIATRARRTTAKAAPKPARKEVRRRVVVKISRSRRPQAGAPQNFALVPNYQVMPQAAAVPGQTAQAPQAVRRHAAARRFRATKKAANGTAGQQSVVGGAAGGSSMQ